LPFSQRSQWVGVETEDQLLLLLRQGKSVGRHIVSLPNQTEIQEGDDKQ
jgi:hypothetical protein